MEYNSLYERSEFNYKLIKSLTILALVGLVGYNFIEFNRRLGNPDYKHQIESVSDIYGYSGRRLADVIRGDK